MNIIALICARSGSKGVPNKNIKIFDGEAFNCKIYKPNKGT